MSCPKWLDGFSSGYDFWELLTKISTQLGIDLL
jgi:hypothetical protein